MTDYLHELIPLLIEYTSIMLGIHDVDVLKALVIHSMTKILASDSSLETEMVSVVYSTLYETDISKYSQISVGDKI